MTHVAGALLSIWALGALVRVALDYGTIWHLVSFSIFGASLVLLYSFSSLYHLLPLSEEGILRMRKLDHIMIFVLIAGSYTPFCLVPLHGPWGWTLFGIVWGSALIGLVIKLFWMHAPRWLSTFIYLLMGWSCVIAIYPLIKTVPTGGMFWLIFGGLIYTVGAVIYAMKWPNFGFKHFGFHELWHLFVMGGSASHFIAVYHYVTYL